VNKAGVGALIGIIILIAGAGYFWFLQQENLAREQTAKRQADIARQKQASVFDLTSKQAGALALNKLTISKTSQTDVGESDQYFALSVKITDGKKFADLLHQFYNKPTSLVVVTAENVRAPLPALAAPILILRKGELVYAANGIALPFEASPSGGATDIALDIHYLDDKASNGDISKLLNLAKQLSAGPVPWSTDQREKLFDNSTALIALMKNRRAKFYDNLWQVHIGPEGKMVTGRAMALKNSTGRIELTVSARPAKFLLPNEKGQTIVRSSEIDQFLHHGNLHNKDLQVNFWLNEGEGFVDTCRDLSTSLLKQAGLSLMDTSLVLWSLIHRHAWFAKDIDYQTDCLDEAQTAALKELRLALPNKKNARQSTPRNATMNKILATLVKVLRNDDPESTKVNLSAMIAEKTTLLDRAGVWLYGEQVLQNDAGRIIESANQQAAIDQLFALPVSHFGCFSRGDGLKGRHRTTLAQFGASTDLWELEFAFNAKGKIAGITLDEADNETICRAIGDRRSGENACYFAKRAKSFPIIAKAKCG
jgi:hypothetical protein